MSANPENLRSALQRSPLSRDRIVDSALDLAKDQGLAAVSMRRLAKELGVQPMSLYYHVPSRAVLMVLMAERSITAVPESEPGARWDERLVALMLGLYRAGVDDPAVFPVLASETLGTKMLPSTPSAAGAASVGLIERVELLLVESGVPKAMRPAICRGLIGLVVGFLVGQVDGLVPTGGDRSPESGPGDAADEADLGDVEDESPPARIRAIHVDDPAADLANAVRVFVRGLAA